MTITARKRFGHRIRPNSLSSRTASAAAQKGGPIGAATAASKKTATGSRPRGGLAGTVAFELSPWVPTTGDPFDTKKAAHLMRRAGFGATPRELEEIVKIGFYRTLDLLTIPSQWGTQEFGSVILPSGELLNLTWNLAGQRAHWIHECVTTHFPLKEKMALFWHDHFSVGANSSQAYPMLLPHINIFRRHGLRDLRSVLVDVSRDPAMLWWLDNRINGAGGKVNENYGREILELYTMGVSGGYTQKDVYETSRCFAGWSLSNYNKYLYRTSYATAGAGVKTVLGSQVYHPFDQEKEGEMLIDLLLKQKVTSEYITSKIWSYFVAERPAADVTEQQLWDAIIVELAKRWRDAGYSIRALMWTVFASNYFMDKSKARSRRALAKNPMEYLVGAIRNLGVPFVGRYYVLGTRVEQMGLPLLRYGNPAGLEDGTAWIDSQSLINRANYVDDLTQASTTRDFRVQWNPLTEVARAGVTKSKDIVDHFVKILVDGEIPAVVRKNLHDFMDYYDGTPNHTYNPYDNLAPNSRYRVEKIRGVVHLIMSLPEYQMN